MDGNPRAEILRRLNGAVGEATAGEIHRAVEFLRFARQVRVGKREIRRQPRGRRTINA